MKVKLDWDLFYDKSEISSYFYKEKRITLSTDGLYRFYKCSFIDQSAETGGSIYISTNGNNVKILIEDSLFYKCYSTSATGYGGAIYSEGNGQFIVHRTCGDACHTTFLSGQTSETHGQFLFSSTNKGFLLFVLLSLF